MHLSMHNWMRVESISETAARLKRFGYESVEISGEPELYASHGEVKAALDEHGIRCFGGVTIMTEGRDLIATDEATRHTTIEYMKACVDLVAGLDGEELSIVPSTVGKTEPETDSQTEWGWAVESLKAIYDHAQAKGVRLALEPLNRFETYFLNRGDQAVALAEAVGPDCGVCLDTFHSNIEDDDIVGAIRSVGSRLVDFHVADNNRMAPGMGALDWPAIIGALHEIGYDSAVTVEFVMPLDRTPVDRFPEALETDLSGLTDTQRKFIEDHGGNVISEPFYTELVRRSAAELTPLLAVATR
jgi:sugar phosphate isomerase/epimerase